MALVVQKYGGTSVADLDRIRNVARRVARTCDKGDDVVYLVVRQHADKKGGWHTKPGNIRDLVKVALAEGRRAWEANRS